MSISVESMNRTLLFSIFQLSLPIRIKSMLKPRSHCPGLMPQSHTHLRTLRMIRKAHPHRSVHSVTIRNYTYLIRRVRNSSYLIRKTRSIRAQILKNIKKSSADEQNAIIRNSWHSYVSIRISSVSHPLLNVSKPITPQTTQSCGLIRFYTDRYV